MKHFKYRIKPKCLFFSTPHSSNNKKKGFGVAMKSVFSPTNSASDVFNNICFCLRTSVVYISRSLIEIEKFPLISK